MDPEFEKTYRDHYPKLFRIAAKMLQDPEGAKDVVQDVFTAYYFAMSNEKTSCAMAVFTTAFKC
ncbi:MAG: hypothetical protein IKI09_09550 [Bacteroidales bacterium]|nr:hypothetical protein [Bacteroidales bacterium]